MTVSSVSLLFYLALTLPGGEVGAATADSPGTLWSSDSLTKVMPSAVPAVDDAGSPMRIRGAKGEIASGQAVFRPRTRLSGVTATISDMKLRGGVGAVPASAIKLQWVRSIDVTRNTAGVPADELIVRAPASIPDPYWETGSIALAAGRSQPLWIEVHVPRRAASGDYDGTLTVAAGEARVQLAVTLHVSEFEVPEERHLSVINWWRFPGHHDVERYSEEYWSLLARFCAFVVEHRQTDINAGFDLIVETQGPEGAMAHDTRRLERYAETAFATGIRQIHLHSLGRRTAHITDPTSRIEGHEGNFRKLAALEKVTVRRGWRRRFAVSISDEPFVHHEETYAALVERAHRTAPSVRCVEAVETEFLGKLDIYVPKLSHLNLWYPRFDEVRRGGAELWFYTCCHPTGRYANRFLDQSLLKVRVLHWINYLYDLDGYLHWGLNQFNGTRPYTQEGISHGLPLGDRAIAYPGKDGLVGSLRFSALRDGLEDFEYLWVLEERVRRLKERVGPDAFWVDPRQRPLELCRRVVWSFHEYTRDPAVLLATRRQIAEEIEALHGEPLLFVQTSPPEGSVIPAGPRHVIVRGLTSPGARVLINGRPVKNVRPSGYFLHAHFMPDERPEIRITADDGGKKRTVERRFRLTD